MSKLLSEITFVSLFKISLNKKKENITMKKNLKLVGYFVLASLVFVTSCTKDDDKMVTPTSTDNGGSNYEVPTTYTFVDASGNSTVSFEGQQQRLDMLSEMVVYMKSANTLGNSVDATTLKNMYANNGYTWTDANGLGMTGSTKQLKNKTAGGDTGVQSMFETYMDSIASLSNLNYSNSSESYGMGGVWSNGTESYLQGANGYEYDQLIEKGLMCAVFMNQMTANYLSRVNNDDNTTIVTGETYTVMQRSWDEAYGYFTSEVDYPASGIDRFWGKYANSVESVLGSGSAISTAFRKGRAAIDNKDYATRDAQINIIRDEIERVCAGIAIGYLNEAKVNFTNPTIKNKVLSEAIAFIDGLRYGYNSINEVSISSAEINQALAIIGTDFVAISINNINMAIDLIASKTGLESVKADL